MTFDRKNGDDAILWIHIFMVIISGLILTTIVIAHLCQMAGWGSDSCHDCPKQTIDCVEDYNETK